MTSNWNPSRLLAALIAFGFAFLTSASGRAQSNSCASATTITDGTYLGTTVGATNDGSATCGGSTTSPDVWYRYVAAQNCSLIVMTCGSSYDTVLSIHQGCPGTSGNQLVCNDDACNLQSSVQVNITAGSTYWIRVAGFGGATGAFTLNVTCVATSPGAEFCNSASPVSPGMYSGSTQGASNDGIASCGASTTSPDVWYSFTPTENCRLRLTTCGSTYDTVLSIHSSCPGALSNELVCNDDACGLQSIVATNVQAGNTYYIRVAGFGGSTGNYTLNVACSPTAVGADLQVDELDFLTQQGRIGDVVGCSMQSTFCNRGDAPVDWMQNPNVNHPFVVWNLYRLSNGRFEQLGQSWAHHGSLNFQGDECTLGCTPGTGQLGVGCSVTDDVTTNGTQSTMGPRAEIDPWTGAFTYDGSHIATQTGGHDAIEHRLQLRDADLNPATNPGATYYSELYAVAHDDSNHMNSVAWEPVTITGVPGGVWSFNLGPRNTRLGPAIEAWSGATRTTIPEATVDDGRAILAAQATDNGNGTWHYEYALYNLDLARQVGSFSLPVSPDIAISATGFHAVASAGEGYSNVPWVFSRSSDAITWATDSFQQNPNANPLRWGTTYNFWFDADSAPTQTTAALGLYLPGAGSSATGSTQGPSSRSCVAGNVNSSGGAVTDVLLVNGQPGAAGTRIVNVPVRSSITVTLSAAPFGPNPASYVIWVWQGLPASTTNLTRRGEPLGCTVNPTPLQPARSPQPYRCVRGGLPARACGAIVEVLPAPSSAPWTLRDRSGLPAPATFTLQGMLADNAASNTVGYSVTNAVVLVVQ